MTCLLAISWNGASQSLDESPDVGLAHSWTAAIDEESRVVRALPYPLATDARHVAVRLRSQLLGEDHAIASVRESERVVFHTDCGPTCHLVTHRAGVHHAVLAARDPAVHVMGRLVPLDQPDPRGLIGAGGGWCMLASGVVRL